MRVVIDTNIVVSAALRGGKPASIIFEIIAQPDYESIRFS